LPGPKEKIVIAVVVIAAALVAGLAVWRLWSVVLARVTVYEYERGLRFDRGRFSAVVEPGAYRILRSRTRITTIDVRPTLVAVPGQEVITADGVSIRISLAAEFGIVDPVTAVIKNGDYVEKLYVALQLALREIVAATEIDALLEQRATVGARLAEMTHDEAARLGLDLVRVDAKDFMFPGELRRTFAQVVAARKEGLAALERARGETAALRNLANAARMMESSPSLLQLRALQEIGRSGGNTVVLGLPSSVAPLPLREGTQADVEATPELPLTDE
jgi:regulator of protease activity HflC (stomatin/prohibitin superfamily)